MRTTWFCWMFCWARRSPTCDRSSRHRKSRAQGKCRPKPRRSGFGPRQTIGCAGETLERVIAFTYLGSLITTTGGTEEHAEARYRKAQAAFSVLRPIWRSKLISVDKDTFLRFQCEVGFALWTLDLETNKEDHCPTLGVWWPRKISNEELWQRTKQVRVTLWGNLQLTSPACPLSGTLRELGERQNREVTENHTADAWGLGDVMESSETDCTKPRPMESCSRGPMLRTKRRGPELKL